MRFDEVGLRLPRSSLYIHQLSIGVTDKQVSITHARNIAIKGKRFDGYNLVKESIDKLLIKNDSMFLKRISMTVHIRIFVWIVVVLVYSTSSIGKEVVDFRSATAKKHLVFDEEFANLDSRGSEELVLIENGFADSSRYAVSISQIVKNSRDIIWRGQEIPILSYKILVGNLDSDEHEEVLIHRAENDLIDDRSPDTVRLINFESGEYQETLYTSISGEYGALIDVNNDGKSEIVMVTTVVTPSRVRRLDPSKIRVYSFDDDRFDVIGSLELEHTIRCLTVGDVDGDGNSEIVTQEASHDGKIHHQISVYDVSSGGSITHQFSKNRVLTFSPFPTRVREMRVFTHSDSHSYIATYRGHRWISRVYYGNGIEDITEVKEDDKLRTEAYRHRLPFNGEFYGLIKNRNPRLILYKQEELSEIDL